MQTRDEGLRREIGVFGLSANIINIVVGAGIFALPAVVASSLGPAAVLAYLVCGVLVALIMLCFAEAGSKITTSGGAYSYIEEAFGKYAGFLAAFLFLAASISADAAIANALMDTLSLVLPVCKQLPVRILFFAILFSGLTYINITGVKQGIGLVKINTIAKLLPLLLLVIIGWTQVTASNLSIHEMPSARTLGAVSLLLFFAFQGAESGLTVGGEVRNPGKTIPRGILIGVSFVLILYLLIQGVAQGILGASLSQYQEAPLSETAGHVFGTFGFTLVTIGAAISMFGALSGDVLSIPRIAFRAAKDNVIPIKLLASVHPKFATPFVAIITYAGLDFILASSGGFKQLAVVASASMLLIYFGVAASVVRFRQTKESMTKNAFRIPGGYLVPIVAVVIIIWLISSLSKQELIGALIFIAGLSVIYLIIRAVRNQQSPPSSEGPTQP